MDSNNLNVLVEARKEYLQQLHIVICPTMIQVFEEMYEEAAKLSKNKKTLVQYQKLLREVVNWNEHMIHKHTETICSSCNWFNDLLAAVFVSSVKILSSVRLNSDGNKISLKLPNNKVFIHGCFIAASKDLFKNPYVYHEDSVEQERDAELTIRFSKCIEETVKEMIPVQEILKSCMSQVNKEENIDFDSSIPDDAEVSESEMGEEEDEGMPEDSEMPEATPEVPDVECENPVAEEDETKNINVGKNQPGASPTGEGEDDDVLFNDAPDGQKEKIN